MIKVKVKDKSYQVKSEWTDITIKDAGNILMLERSQRLTDFFSGKDIDLSVEERGKELPKFAGELLALCSNIPSEVIDMMHPTLRIEVCNESCAKFISGLITMSATGLKLDLIKSFTHEGKQYVLPSWAELDGVKTPFIDLDALTFAEMADLQNALIGITIPNEFSRYASLLVAVSCRDISKKYSESEIIKEAKGLLNLPMNLFFEVFFSTVVELTTYYQCTLHNLQEKVREQMQEVSESLFTRSLDRVLRVIRYANK